MREGTTSIEGLPGAMTVAETPTHTPPLDIPHVAVDAACKELFQIPYHAPNERFRSCGIELEGQSYPLLYFLPNCEISTENFIIPLKSVNSSKMLIRTVQGGEGFCNS